MTFRIDPERLQELARLEEEAGCDIEAGLDLGRSAGVYLASAKSYIDRGKLLSVLQEGLGNVLSSEEIEAIAADLQYRTQNLVKEKLQSTQSA